MFRPEEIQARLKGQRFVPFRIIASEGIRYDIAHPDLVMVGQRSITIGFANPARPTPYHHIIQLALIHVVGLEELNAPTEDITIHPADTAA